MNTSQKGYRKEKLIRDLFKEEGYINVFKSIRTRFGCQDFAGLFDGVAIKGSEWVFWSSRFCTNSNYQHPHRIAIAEFKKNHGLHHMKFELWLWKDRNPPRIINI